MMLLQILWGILSLSLLIVVHEWGHYYCARRVGVVVERFAVFLGPALWKRRRGQTVYSLGVIPLGGYCKMRSHLSSLRHPEAGDFYASPWTARLLVACGGPLASVVLGMLLLWLLNLLPQSLPPRYPSRVVVMPQLRDQQGLAFAAGLRTGDRIVAIDGQPVDEFSALVRLRELDRPFRLTYQRDGQTVQLDFQPLAGRYLGVAAWVEPRFQRVPRALARQGVETGDLVVAADEVQVTNTYDLAQALRAGASALRFQSGRTATLPPSLREALQQSQPYFIRVEYSGLTPPWQAFGKAGAEVRRMFRLLGQGLSRLFNGGAPLSESLTGPLRLSEFIGSSLTLGGDVWASWLWLMALISLNLALVNMLPLPGLDGGMVFFTLLLVLLPRRWWEHGYRIYSWSGNLLLLALLALVFGLDLSYYLGAL